MNSKAERPKLKLAPWSDQSLAELGVSLACERSQRPLRSRWHTTLVRRGVQGRPLADVSVEVRTLGPVALRRTVRLETSDRSVRLELGRGLEFGVGMPKWLRSARAFAQEEAVGALTIGPGLVTLAAVVPVGMAWQRFLSRHDRPVLHDRDQSHPTLAGSYLAACAFLAVLFQENPVGIDAEIAGLAGEDRVLLQRAAWQECRSLVSVSYQ